jgi:hypothetical protein
MADLATLQTRLAEAEAALHQLATGAKAQSVTTDSGAITYTPANLPGLQAYVLHLKAQIGAASGTPMRRTFMPGFGR